jgi:hypothetical protein
MIYELYIAGHRADINEQISVQLTYAIDDVAQFGNRNTSFSKQIVLPGTARNNALFGHVHELGNNNLFSPGQPNIGGVFNVAQTTPAELRLNGLLVLRGVFRLLGIVKNREQIEYEGALFGELGGLITEISNKRLEDLDFSEYDHILSHTEIEDSWNSTPGSGYFYPLIDYGNYRNNDDYNIGTFRPALYVKEYIDKMFAAAGYTYQSDFINSNLFKSLIVPHNTKQLTKLATRLLTATETNGSDTITGDEKLILFDTAIGGNFTINGTNSLFTYNAVDPVLINLKCVLTAQYTAGDAWEIVLEINTVEVDSFSFPSAATSESINIELNFNGTLNQNDIIGLNIRNSNLTTINITNVNALLTVDAAVATVTLVANGDTVSVNDTVPKGIYQKDFFASILKMFNLYVDEDKLNEKNLIIKPYDTFFSGQQIDWSRKVARDKVWQILPMGQLNGRIFEYKYKDDSDFYNEQYKKKYNKTYGDRQFDTGFQFAQDRLTTEIIFSPSPIIKYDTDDKLVVAIYKKSNALSAEDRMDSNIRILFSKKITGVSSWNIKNGGTDHIKNTYGYAGHLDDPATPTYDLNFGAAQEVYATLGTYPSRNLFNEYWSGYIAEIADKDSKLLKCYVHLTPLDVAQLDFAKYVFIDGVLFRINKIEDYDPANNELTRVELLKVIHG